MYNTYLKTNVQNNITEAKTVGRVLHNNSLYHLNFIKGDTKKTEFILTHRLSKITKATSKLLNVSLNTTQTSKDYSIAESLQSLIRLSRLIQRSVKNKLKDLLSIKRPPYVEHSPMRDTVLVQPRTTVNLDRTIQYSKVMTDLLKYEKFPISVAQQTRARNYVLFGYMTANEYIGIVHKEAYGRDRLYDHLHNATMKKLKVHPLMTPLKYTANETRIDKSKKKEQLDQLAARIELINKTKLSILRSVDKGEFILPNDYMKLYSELRLIWFADPEDYIILDNDDYFMSNYAGD